MRNDIQANVEFKRGIYLIGFSGTGKSTTARLIAEKVCWPSYDLDQIVVERSGMTIPMIFEREGEEGFRRREAEALHEVSAQGPFVVATGGGAFTREVNRQFMTKRGWIICLEARPETLYLRIQRQLKKAGQDAVRPMLDAIDPLGVDPLGVDPLDQVRSLKGRRQAIYALADWTVHTDRLSPEQVADEVIRAADLLERSGADFSGAEPPRPIGRRS